MFSSAFVIPINEEKTRQHLVDYLQNNEKINSIKMNTKAKYIASGAIIAAMYVALCHLQNLLIPNSASFAIQFRAAEALCVLALFTPAAIPGLTLGCLIFNLISGATALDFVIGSAASCLAACAMWAMRKITVKGYPLPAMLMPALFNGILVGWELAVLLGLPGGFWVNAAYVAIGEVAVLLTLGSAVYFALRSRHLDKRMFE